MGTSDAVGVSAEAAAAALILRSRTAPQDLPRATIEPFHREIIDFLLIWSPFGGPPEDQCLPLFGLTRHQLVQRIRAIVDGSQNALYSSADCAVLARVARLVGREPGS